MSVVDLSVFAPTPLSPRTARLNHANKWHAWSRYHIPDAYEGLAPELRALHERVTLEDKSPMNWYAIAGRDARRFLGFMLPRDVDRLAAGAALYTPWLDEQGKVVIDTPVFRVDEDTYVSIGGRLIEWLESHSKGCDVRIADLSDEFLVMPLQGPRSRATLEAATREDWSTLRFMRGRRTRIGGCAVYVWRAGYAATLGYELHASRADAVKVYDAIMEAGAPFGIGNIGQNAVQVARVEAGIVVPGLEYARSGRDANIAAYVTTLPEDFASPFELGFGKLVELDKPEDFVGKRALVEERARGGAPRRLVGLEVDWRDIAALYAAAGEAPEISRRIDYRRHPLRHDGDAVGKASSMCWSPTLKKLIALAQVKRELARPGTRLVMDWCEHGTRLTAERIAETVHGRIGATVVELPFVPKNAKLQ